MSHNISDLSQETLRVTRQVLFIDEVHMLDVECFAFLNRALESPLVLPVLQCFFCFPDNHPNKRKAHLIFCFFVYSTLNFPLV